MKQLAAILFLLLLVFNLAGYRLLLYYMQQQADKELQSSLDNDIYDEADLITISLSLSLPYITDNVNFERIDGEVQIGSNIYKYVKRKFSHGKLILLCLPDEHRTQLQNARNEFFKQTNDLQKHNDKKQDTNHTIRLQNLLANYDKPINDWLIKIWMQERSLAYSSYMNLYTAPVIAAIKKPPERIDA